MKKLWNHRILFYAYFIFWDKCVILQSSSEVKKQEFLHDFRNEIEKLLHWVKMYPYAVFMRLKRRLIP